MTQRHGARAALVIAFVLVLAAGACTDDDAETTTTAAPTTTAAATTTTTAAEETTTTTTMAPGPEEPEIEVPFLALWEGSPHNAAEDEAFVHWDEDDPPEVPTSCAKCHSTTGHLDFLGADGTAFGSVEAAAPIGETIQCVACHNQVTIDLHEVAMPSGIVLTDLGDESRCMNCHQGRESGVSVAAAIEESGADVDEVSEDLRFLNIHYYAAAATKYGTEAQGGYEYEGNTYDAFFVHVEDYQVCQDCHDPHTLELKIEECSACHAGVSTVDDLMDVRMPGSLVDYDGDGDLAEGVYYELQGMQGLLYLAMQRYAAEVAGSGILYDADSYPYFFNDTNGDGEASDDEVNRDNAFSSWTPRLLKAAYNYQVSLKDPGAFAHGGKYIMELLYDGVVDLNSAISDPVSLEEAHRVDHGHFAGSEEPFRHWDEDDPAVVPANCSKCHSAEGLPLFLAEGVTISQPPANGFLCSTCHSDLSTWERYEAGPVTFPSGLEVDTGDPNANLCINCHQGRESTASVNRTIGDVADDTVSDTLRFRNIHYLPAGATLFGTEAQGAYEYAGQTYAGRRVHVEAYDTCTECHDAHALEVVVEECGVCHGGVATEDDLATIRMQPDDWDGDGDTTEGVAGEVETMREALLTAMQDYAAATEGVEPIVYEAHSYPYFFTDANGNGELDEGESAYATWTPRLLRAAYNYQYATKDPGAFAHNPPYVLQVLYDTLADIGADVSAMTRPEA